METITGQIISIEVTNLPSNKKSIVNLTIDYFNNKEGMHAVTTFTKMNLTEKQVNDLTKAAFNRKPITIQPTIKYDIIVKDL